MNVRPAILALAALFATAAHAAPPTPSPCALLTPDQIKVVLSSPVLMGKPGSADCTWADAHGETRVYLSLKDATDFHSLRDSMQATGRLVPITGLAEDAFFVSGTGSAAALYALKRKRVLLLTVDGVGFSKAQNVGAEKALATQLLPKL